VGFSGFESNLSVFSGIELKIWRFFQGSSKNLAVFFRTRVTAKNLEVTSKCRKTSTKNSKVGQLFSCLFFDQPSTATLSFTALHMYKNINLRHSCYILPIL
jgi:hypothetical protein